MARPIKSEIEKLNSTISFRTTDAEYLEFKRQCDAAGFTQSELFRDYTAKNKLQVIARQKATPDAKRAVFLLQKASNNINQLAHLANAEHRANKLSEDTFAAIIGQLQQLNQFMLEQTSEVTK